MPVTRRSTSGSRARPGPEKNQSIISFVSRVTKPGARAGAKSSSSKDKDAVAAAAIVPTPSPPATRGVSAEVVEEEEDEGTAEGECQESEAEKIHARKALDEQIHSFLGGIDKARLAGPVHQEDLSEAERVLRYFDVDVRFGPCIGISRTRRWERALRLGLDPPVLVLAVLVQEKKDRGTADAELAHMDRLMSSTAVGVV